MGRPSGRPVSRLQTFTNLLLTPDGVSSQDYVIEGMNMAARHEAARGYRSPT